jgi:hypothetical protein
MSFTVTFTPRASGTAAASIPLGSNAFQTPMVENLTGSGMKGTQHSVSLSWLGSTSSVVGYNVYRSGTAGGPYTKLTAMPDDSTNYVELGAKRTNLLLGQHRGRLARRRKQVFDRIESVDSKPLKVLHSEARLLSTSGAMPLVTVRRYAPST